MLAELIKHIPTLIHPSCSVVNRKLRGPGNAHHVPEPTFATWIQSQGGRTFRNTKFRRIKFNICWFYYGYIVQRYSWGLGDQKGVAQLTFSFIKGT